MFLQLFVAFTDEVDVTVANGSMEFPAGFGSPNSERRHCISFNINDDELHEATESFTLRLELQEQSRVTLQPNFTQISILNDDGMTFI